MKNNNKIDFKETCCWDVDWIQLAENTAQWRATANTVMNIRVHKEWRAS
jgi:hypothetical protein